MIRKLWIPVFLLLVLGLNVLVISHPSDNIPICENPTLRGTVLCLDLVIMVFSITLIIISSNDKSRGNGVVLFCTVYEDARYIRQMRRKLIDATQSGNITLIRGINKWLRDKCQDEKSYLN